MLLTLIFRATELQERPKLDISQKPLSCTLVSSKTLVLNAVPCAAGEYA